MCRRPIKDRPSHARVYCSVACAAIARQVHLSPKTPLGRFLFSQWRASGETLSAWARSVGIHRETLRELMQDCRPIDRTYTRLHAVYGDALPASPTETERRRQIILANQGNPHTPEAVAKSAASRRGKSQAPERVAKREATMRGSSGHERRVEALRLAAQSLSKRILTGLPKRLGTLKGPPTPEILRTWAEATAATAGVSPKEVMAVWRPYLRKRGIFNAGGRPVHTERCRIAAEEWSIAPPRQSQHGPDAYWHRVAQRVSLAEQASRPFSRQDMQRWESKHPPHPGCPLAAAKAKTANTTATDG